MSGPYTVVAAVSNTGSLDPAPQVYVWSSAKYTFTTLDTSLDENASVRVTLGY